MYLWSPLVEWKDRSKHFLMICSLLAVDDVVAALVVVVVVVALVVDDFVVGVVCQ